MNLLLITLILGLVEGITEFLPVSSTGHLILATKLLGFDDNKWDVFNIVIQFGAIMAIVVLYWGTFFKVLTGLLKRENGALLFTRNLLVAVVPALFLGALLHKHIEANLHNAAIVAWALIVGGVGIIVIERLAKRVAVTQVQDMPLHTALTIGFAQCLAMIPGVSRSGATIMGALTLGVDRKTAAEFSFFLAVPTMIAASAYQLFSHRHDMGEIGLGLIGLGSLISFVVALVVVKAFVAIISKRGFTPFAYYRIMVGVVALLWMHFGHIA
jgi:undecaprenyl-diphosphatase